MRIRNSGYIHHGGHVDIVGQAIGGDADDSATRKAQREIDAATAAANTSGARANDTLLNLGGSLVITDSVIGPGAVKNNKS